MTTTMPRPSPRRLCGPTCASCKRSVGSARPAGIASRTRAAGVAPHGDDQADPRLSHRARDRRSRHSSSNVPSVSVCPSAHMWRRGRQKEGHPTAPAWVPYPSDAATTWVTADQLAPRGPSLSARVIQGATEARVAWCVRAPQQRGHPTARSWVPSRRRCSHVCARNSKACRAKQSHRIRLLRLFAKTRRIGFLTPRTWSRAGAPLASVRTT